MFRFSVRCQRINPKSRGTLDTALVSWLVIVIVILCFTGVAGQDHSNCTYKRDLSKQFPYPYDRHEWFSLLQNAYQRQPPKWLSHGISGVGLSNKVLHIRTHPGALMGASRVVPLTPF
jgi:hypothetical protein